MEWLYTLFESLGKIPIGKVSKIFFDFLKTNFKGDFSAFGDAVKSAIEGFSDLLQSVPTFLLVIGFIVLTWFIQKKWQRCLLVLVCFLFIINQGYWKQTVETLSLVTFVCAICMTIGIPIGVAAAHRPRLYTAMQPILDLMQTLPAPVYLIPFVIMFSIGVVPALFASIIFVVPTSIRLTHLGVSTTPTALIEALTAFGATKRQVLWKAELPYAFPQIMAGLNQTIMLSLSMVVISAWGGAAGLGVPVVEALNRVRPDQGFEAGSVIVALAIALDRMLRKGDA
ncbi:MAG: ABC transporter permease subunit [Alphaproteobacteria bacterium]|nr:ABC transporter permease subunit [Alphaproteobacteria bacterium]